MKPCRNENDKSLIIDQNEKDRKDVIMIKMIQAHIMIRLIKIWLINMIKMIKLLMMIKRITKASTN